MIIISSQHSDLGSKENTEYHKIVYNNAIPATQTDVRSETTSAKIAKRRSMSMKCDNCKSPMPRALKHHYSFRIMKRLYIKDQNRWKTIGWYCSNCGSIVLDGFVKPFSFFRIPNPKITLIERQAEASI